MTPTGTMLQVHLLTSYPAVLLNRDDAGLAKRMPFGGAVRTRISSQCLKKHWREAPLLTEAGTTAVRSRLVFERFVADPLHRDHGLTNAEADAVASLLLDAMLPAKAEAVDAEDGDDESDDAEGGGALGTRAKQVLVLSEPEVQWLTETALEVVRLAREAGISLASPVALRKLVGRKENRAFWKARAEILGALAASVDVALFGRFVTSDLLARVDAAVSVAHAITTHAELAETDYFTAIDMLDTESSGAGHLNDTELTSGVFYTYAVVDLDQLRRNLGPETPRAEELAGRLTRTMATFGSRAKRGSTAPFARAEFVLLERGEEQPRSLANAFRTPVPLHSAEGDVLVRSINALLEHRRRLAAMYGDAPDAVAATIHPDVVGDSVPVMPLDTAIARVLGLAAPASYRSPQHGPPAATPAARA